VTFDKATNIHWVDQIDQSEFLVQSNVINGHFKNNFVFPKNKSSFVKYICVLCAKQGIGFQILEE